MPRPDPTKCSQFRSWEFKGTLYRGCSGTIDDENLDEYRGAVFEFDLRSDGSGAAPSVGWMDETRHAEVFGKEGQKLEDVHPIKRFPSIWLSHARVLLCRHGQICCLVDGTKKVEAMEVETFRLGALFVLRTRYPSVLLWSGPTFSNWRCHNQMGWACFGDRQKDLVTDHNGQDNKQAFSEKNLEYVSRSVTSRRHQTLWGTGARW